MLLSYTKLNAQLILFTILDKQLLQYIRIERPYYLFTMRRLTTI